jgi:hypothetical protein
MQQLALSLWPPGSLIECLSTYLQRHGDGLATSTLGDYGDRAEWLIRALGGELTQLEDITFMRLERLVDEWGPRGKGLRLVTIRKRLRFLMACLKYAQDRGIIEKVPRLPKMRDDGERG